MEMGEPNNGMKQMGDVPQVAACREGDPGQEGILADPFLVGPCLGEGPRHPGVGPFPGAPYLGAAQNLPEGPPWVGGTLVASLRHPHTPFLQILPILVCRYRVQRRMCNHRSVGKTSEEKYLVIGFSCFTHTGVVAHAPLHLAFSGD
jgi:hypothetical protein